MPASDVKTFFPLIRMNPVYPGQLGVRGSWNELGMRTSTQGSVFYVNPNHPDPNDSNDGTDPEHPLATVAAALTKCESWHNDMILVDTNSGWTYASHTLHPTPVVESVVVSVHGVSIIGVAHGSPLGVPWHPATSTRIAIHVQAMDVLIEGFCFMGCLAGAGGTAIFCEWDGATKWGESTVIRNNFFDPDIDIGVQLDYAWNCHIHDNEFQGCDAAGIYQDPADSPMEYCSIHDNIFYGVGETAPGGAMDISEAAHCQIFRNSIFNADAQSGAAATNEGINTSAGAGGNQVYDNYFSCLLPVPANGDWDNLNSSDANDAWVGNHCINGMATARPS